MIGLGVIGAAIVVLTLTALPATRAGGDYAYVAMATASGCLALAATYVAERTKHDHAIWLILAIAIFLRLVLLFSDPLLSSDIYRYVWDGKVQAAGINPYRYVPADEALAGFRDSLIYPNINRADYARTIYPPVAQVFFFLATRLAENVTAMKAALLGAEGVTFAAIAFLLRRLGRPVTRLVAYAWHPLPLWQIANSGHVDALMVALMMSGLCLAVTGRSLRGAAVVTLGALVKPFALLALPSCWRPWDWKAPFVVVAVIAACYVPYLSVGWDVLGYLTSGYLAEEHVDTGGSIWLLALWRQVAGVFPGDVLIYFGLSGLVLAAMALHAAFRPMRTEAVIVTDTHHLILACLLLLSPTYPWYFLIATPFVALIGGAPAWTLTIGAILLQDEMRLGFFVPMLPRKTVIFGAFLCACAYAAWQAQRAQRDLMEAK